MRYTFGDPATTWGNGVAWGVDGACGKILREAHLTEVRDPYGNTAKITYATETRTLTPCPSQPYVRTIRPTRLEYFAQGEALATVRVDFGYSSRTDTNVEGSGNGYAEVYWSDYRLTTITVKVRTGSGVNDVTTVRTYQMDHSYYTSGTPGQSIMTLSYIRQLGKDGGALPDWSFGYVQQYGWLNFVLLATANNGQGAQQPTATRTWTTSGSKAAAPTRGAGG